MEVGNGSLSRKLVVYLSEALLCDRNTALPRARRHMWLPNDTLWADTELVQESTGFDTLYAPTS